MYVAMQQNKPDTQEDEQVVKQSSVGSLSAAQCAPLALANAAVPEHKSHNS